MNRSSDPSRGSGASPPIAGSFMRPGDIVPYWGYYDDSFLPVRLAAEVATDRVVACNQSLAGWTTTPAALAEAPIVSFFPPALAAGIEDYRLLQATMTGGRTFLLHSSALDELGFPPLALDLDRLGWGEGALEVRLEVKGAGTLFERARLGQTELERVLVGHPELQEAYEAQCTGLTAPVLMSSLGIYLKRHLGGQSERFARHAVETSARLLGKSAIKFVPVWLAVGQSATVRHNLDVVSRALAPDEPRFEGASVNELRWTPSTVRAVYFDQAECDEHLIELARRVSEDPEELAATLTEILADTRRHLELLATSTQASADGGFYWIKVGDINEKFKPDARGRYRAAEDFRRSRKAWYFAKDEVVVRRVGKFFTDMEGFFGKDVGFHSDPGELDLHHQLVLLAILRDHNRVATRFSLACRLAEGRDVSPAQRRRIQQEVMARLEDAVNESPLLTLHLGAEEVEVTLEHPQLGGQRRRFRFPRQELAEWYREA